MLEALCARDMKAGSPDLRSVSSESGVLSSPRRWRLVPWSSLGRARSGYIAWAHPIYFVFSFGAPLSTLFVKSGSSLSFHFRTRVGKFRWMASLRVRSPDVVSWLSLFFWRFHLPPPWLWPSSHVGTLPCIGPESSRLLFTHWLGAWLSSWLALGLRMWPMAASRDGMSTRLL